LIDKVRHTIEENEMIDSGDKVVVAVSGGPDSMCLLHILYSLKEELKIELVAAHVNHCLRGEEADADEAYVRNFCSSLGIEFYSKKIDIHKIAEERNLSCETAGREVRYDFFQELLTKLNAEKIALAHNANDQAETVLMRIMRGSGMEGLVGIKPVRDNIYIRPIINILRTDIEAYCIENNLNPRIDKSNLENIYNRNKVRLELIPYIQDNFNKDIVNTLIRLSQTIGKDNEYLEKLTEERYKLYVISVGKRKVIRKEAFSEPDAILTRVIRLALLNLIGTLKNFEKLHIYEVINIAHRSTGKRAILPNGVSVVNNYGDIELSVKDGEKLENNNKEEFKIYINKVNDVQYGKYKISAKMVDSEKILNFKNKILTKYFDYDKIKGDITLRYRKDGDRFTPLGMSGSKKLKDIFIDMKIPQEERNKIPLICFGEDIGWIVGYRVSDKYKVTNESKNIIEINIEREELI